MKTKLGSGKRFKAFSDDPLGILVGKLKKKGVMDPDALAAWVGRRKFGKAKFQKMATKGRKRK